MKLCKVPIYHQCNHLSRYLPFIRLNNHLSHWCLR